MKQKIFLAPTLDSGNYLKTLANLEADKTSTFGVRVFNTIELARYVLQCSGVVVEQEFVPNNELAGYLYLKTKEIPYFSSYTFEDVYNLLLSVNELRKCISENEKEEIESKLPRDQFKNKNEAVIKFYNLLVETLEDNNIIDEISLVRLAIEKGTSIDAEFICYQEFILTNLDVALLNKAAGYEVKPITFSNKPLQIKEYLRSFGQNNEVESMLTYIYKNNIKFDECLVVATNENEYSKILSNYQAAIGFPLVIGSGQPISDTNPGRLFASLMEWAASHFHLDYLTKVIYSPSFDLEKFKTAIELPDNFDGINEQLKLSRHDYITFDKIIEVVGNLKLGYINPEINKLRVDNYEALLKKRQLASSSDNINRRDLHILQYVKKIDTIFSEGLSKLLENFSLIDKDNKSVEEYALSRYTLVLSYHERFGVPMDEVIDFLSNVQVGNRKPKEGCLYITSINKGISYLRKHLFIMGLDSKVFPGKCQEDPIIFDRDYLPFGVENASFRKMKENKNNYDALVGFANELGVEIHLSYSFYNSQTVKEQSASSVFFETYKKEHSDKVVTVKDLEDDFKKNTDDKYHTVEYFENNLFPLSKVGQTLNKNIKIIPNKPVESTTPSISSEFLLGKRGLSASAVSNYVDCEYKFFLSNLLGIQQEDETDIYEIIPDNDRGTIIHALMEKYNSLMSEEQFIKLAKEAFEDYFVAHIIEDEPGKAKELKEFLLMAENAYMLEKKESPAAIREEDLVAIHTPTGLKIHGLPDKVINVGDNTYKVIDYKTGRSVRHNPNDLDSMLQGAHYAYVLSHSENVAKKLGKHPKVSEFAFRYLRYGEDFSSSDDSHNIQEYLDQLDTVLARIKESLVNGNFEKADPKKCDKCFYKSVCGGNK